MRGRNPVAGARRARLRTGALAALLCGGFACDVGVREPVFDPVPGYRAPVRAKDAPGEIVTNHGARERLRVREQPPARRARLLFLDGRAATPTPDGGAAWADADGARIVVFDRDGRVSRIVQAEGRGRAVEPVLARVTADGVQVFERDGTALVMDGDGVFLPAPVALPQPVTGADATRLAASRSLLFLPLALVQAGEPLLWVASALDTQPRPMGTVRPPEEPLLGHLVNAGWALPARDGGAYFAPAIRPELVRIGPDGRTVWTATWPAPGGVRPPAIEAVDGTARAAFHVLQHAVAAGDDGRIYVLGAAGRRGGADRILVFEADGVLAREGRVPAGHAVFADARGAVYTVPRDLALSEPDARRRAAFEPFDLPALDPGAAVRLTDFPDRVVVVNFWASWCPPCVREIPLLDSLAMELNPARAVVIGLNEDRDPQRGVAFLDGLGGVSYPNAAGRGELRRAYGYRGLPYTVILDRYHRVVKAFYGFGGSVEPVRDAVFLELNRELD